MNAAGIHQQRSAWNKHNPSGGLGGRIPLVRTVFGLSTIAVCAKIFGFAEKVVVAGFFGTGDTADVYFASMAIVLSIVFLVRELVYPSFLPVFAGSLAKPPSVPGELFRKMFFSAAAFLAPVAFIIVLFPQAVTGLLAPGFAGPKRELTANLLRLLKPSSIEGLILLGVLRESLRNTYAFCICFLYFVF